MRALFGVAGSSRTYRETVSRSSLQEPAWLRSIGLDVLEYSGGRGLHIGEEAARALGTEAVRNQIALSLHAPYFINLANPGAESFRKNADYALQACRTADWMGADRVVVHSGAPMGQQRADALRTAAASLREILKIMDGEGLGHLTLCPETMGKRNQLGDLEETLALCAVDERLIPCVDFGHLYARSLGACSGREAFEWVLDAMERELGRDRAEVFHCHFSKIEFTEKGGELRHLNFEDPGWGPDFAPLAEALAARGFAPRIISESAGNQSEDALAMKRLLSAALERKRREGETE